MRNEPSLEYTLLGNWVHISPLETLEMGKREDVMLRSSRIKKKNEECMHIRSETIQTLKDLPRLALERPTNSFSEIESRNTSFQSTISTIMNDIIHDYIERKNLVIFS
jgi:hypothetical protein